MRGRHSCTDISPALPFPLAGNGRAGPEHPVGPLSPSPTSPGGSLPLLPHRPGHPRAGTSLPGRAAPPSGIPPSPPGVPDGIPRPGPSGPPHTLPVPGVVHVPSQKLTPRRPHHPDGRPSRVDAAGWQAAPGIRVPGLRGGLRLHDPGCAGGRVHGSPPRLVQCLEPGGGGSLPPTMPVESPSWTSGWRRAWIGCPPGAEGGSSPLAAPEEGCEPNHVGFRQGHPNVSAPPMQNPRFHPQVWPAVPGGRLPFRSARPVGRSLVERTAEQPPRVPAWWSSPRPSSGGFRGGWPSASLRGGPLRPGGSHMGATGTRAIEVPGPETRRWRKPPGRRGCIGRWGWVDGTRDFGRAPVLHPCSTWPDGTSGKAPQAEAHRRPSG